jgi:hypothetical protein
VVKVRAFVAEKLAALIIFFPIHILKRDGAVPRSGIEVVHRDRLQAAVQKIAILKHNVSDRGVAMPAKPSAATHGSTDTVFDKDVLGLSFAAFVLARHDSKAVIEGVRKAVPDVNTRGV